ncbi:TonB-dependent siderophore receptor [Sphingobium cloacae]|uniref:Secretin/TonB short N-terminal domain-containing protein n=1 Tax=Sphingobium cloacae TaxID=120107 RepID=A0A1E1EY09_9SPHN|nr:TonB-dependent siderophore receptor [Sphingobium cloacae]BAV63092.1 hypothetical protein SCLO_1000520 [Sphingobium cloacae]
MNSKYSQTAHIRPLRSALGAILLTTTGLATTAFAFPGAAAAQAVHVFDIPAGSLADAINSFGEQGGAQILYDAALTQGRDSAGLKGRFGVAEGLSRLLAGSGITFRQTGPNIFTLEPAPQSADGAIQLGPVRVEGEGAGRGGSGIAETATGPVTGYVATRTATGSKTDSSILEIPQTISILTRDRIEAQGGQSINDSVRYTAGVRSNFAGANPKDDALIIRGFSQFTSNFYVDGVRLLPTTSYFSQEPYGFERIEILKGPSSVLYGQNAPGGLINLVTKRPTEDRRGEVAILAGTQNRLEGTLDVSGPVTSDGALLYRLVGLARNLDQQIDYLKDDRVYIAPSIAWHPGEATSLLVQASYQKDHSLYLPLFPYQTMDGSNPNGRIPRSRFMGEPGYDRGDMEVYSFSYELKQRLNDHWNFKQTVRYSHADDYFQWLYKLGLLTNNRTVGRSYNLRKITGDSIGTDNAMTGEFRTGALSHTVLFGLDYIRRTTNVLSIDAPASGIDLYDPVYGQSIAPVYGAPFQTRQTNHQTGLYFQDQIRSGGWVLTIGGRQDWARQRTLNIGTGVLTKQKDKAFSGRAGLTYIFPNGLAPYASYSESFLPVSGTTSPARGSAPFNPEVAKQWEIGLKFQPEGSPNLVTISLFDLRRQNVSTVDPDDTRYTVQTGEQRSRGVEIETTVKIADRLNVIAAYTYNEVETTKDNPNAAGVDYVGMSPARVPRHLASLWADYSQREGVFKGVRIGMGARYVGPTYGNALNTFKVPGFTLVDAAFNYDLGEASPALSGWNLAVNARNLFDKYYVASCTALEFCNIGEVRSIIGRLTYKW